jgi:hypothetical protein
MKISYFDIKYRVLDESWDHAVWYYLIEATTTIEKTPKKN